MDLTNLKSGDEMIGERKERERESKSSRLLLLYISMALFTIYTISYFTLREFDQPSKAADTDHFIGMYIFRNAAVIHFSSHTEFWDTREYTDPNWSTPGYFLLNVFLPATYIENKVRSFAVRNKKKATHGTR